MAVVGWTIVGGLVDDDRIRDIEFLRSHDTIPQELRDQIDEDLKNEKDK